MSLPGWRFVAVAVPLLLVAAGARAQGRPGGMLLFPDIVQDAGHDTVVRITNTTNSLTFVRCFAIDGPSGAQADSCVLASDFTFPLNRQQPIAWTASQGLVGGGATQVSIPPLPTGFAGSLLCVSENQFGVPIGGGLIGRASVTDRQTGNTSGSSAHVLSSLETADGDTDLVLGEGTDYDPCPAEWVVDVAPDGGEDPVAGSGSVIHSTLTVVPCSVDLERLEWPGIVLQFVVYNDFANRFSYAAAIGCRGSFDLGEIDVFSHFLVGGSVLRVDISSVMQSNGEGVGGFVVAGRSSHQAAAIGGTLAVVPSAGDTPGFDTIHLPQP